MEEEWMAQDSPLVVCAYGWGQTFRLYRSRLEINGQYYPLNELTHVYLVQHRLLGIPSARLKLCLGSKSLILRGIAAVTDAQKAADYLKTWCAGNEPVTDYNAALANAQIPPPMGLSIDQDSDTDRFERIKTNISLPIVRVPVRLLAGEHAHYSTSATLCGERTGMEQEGHRHDAGYYPARDHGMLILTNRRVIYIGRNNQIVLDYHNLLHFSRLRTAVAFQADHWQKRVIFTIPQPIECALYIEAILHRLQQSVSYQEQLL